MRELYLLRHAQSQANRERILASRLPYGLTPEGREDAQRIAEELSAQLSIGRIYSSPLRRARETAEPFERACSIEAIIDERLSEQELGIYTGMGYDQVKTMKGYEKEVANRWEWVPEGGESYEMIARRVSSFFRMLEEQKECSPVLVVTHAVTLRVIRGLLEDSLPAYPLGFPNNGQIWKTSFDHVGKRHEFQTLSLGRSASFVHLP